MRPWACCMCDKFSSKSSLMWLRKRHSSATNSRTSSSDDVSLSDWSAAGSRTSSADDVSLSDSSPKLSSSASDDFDTGSQSCSGCLVAPYRGGAMVSPASSSRRQIWYVLGER